MDQVVKTELQCRATQRGPPRTLWEIAQRCEAPERSAHRAQRSVSREWTDPGDRKQCFDLSEPPLYRVDLAESLRERSEPLERTHVQQRICQEPAQGRKTSKIRGLEDVENDQLEKLKLEQSCTTIQELTVERVTERELKSGQELVPVQAQKRIHQYHNARDRKWEQEEIGGKLEVEETGGKWEQVNTAEKWEQEEASGKRKQEMTSGKLEQENTVGKLEQENTVGKWEQENTVGKLEQEEARGKLEHEKTSGNWEQEEPGGKRELEETNGKLEKGVHSSDQCKNAEKDLFELEEAQIQHGGHAGSLKSGPHHSSQEVNSCCRSHSPAPTRHLPR
jgi:hypothetical protein